MVGVGCGSASVGSRFLLHAAVADLWCALACSACRRASVEIVLGDRGFREIEATQRSVRRRGLVYLADVQASCTRRLQPYALSSLGPYRVPDYTGISSVQVLSDKRKVVLSQARTALPVVWSR